MKLTLWCNHVWHKDVDAGNLSCSICRSTKAEGTPDPQVKIAWGFAKEETVVQGGKPDNQ